MIKSVQFIVHAEYLHILPPSCYIIGVSKGNSFGNSGGSAGKQDKGCILLWVDDGSLKKFPISKGY